MEAIESARDAATRLVAEAFGEVRLGAATPLDGDRAKVLRFPVEDASPGTPASIVVKRAIDRGAAWDVPDQPGGGPTTRFLNEWASLQFLGDVAAERPVAPRLYGADRDAGILVMEDLGPVIGLVESLLGDDPDMARSDLIAYATTVGRMHARSAAHVARFRRARTALGPTDPGFGQAWIGPALHATLDALGLRLTPAVEADMAVVASSMANPGEFAVLIHADPCPGNWTRAGGGDRLFDFEYSGIGHALLDGVYGRVPFPTCWCVGLLPERVTRETELTYRTELGRGCPAALDDARYARAVAEACVFWLILLCHWHPLVNLFEESREWGTGTIRQRLLTRLGVVAEVTAKAGHLTATGELAGTMLQALRTRWEGEVVPLMCYPAFQAG